jgi:hypothetical protein
MWLGSQLSNRTAESPDPVGDCLRAAVTENARVKADCARCHEVRVQGIMDELFASVAAAAQLELPG